MLCPVRVLRVLAGFPNDGSVSFCFCIEHCLGMAAAYFNQCELFMLSVYRLFIFALLVSNHDVTAVGWPAGRVSVPARAFHVLRQLVVHLRAVLRLLVVHLHDVQWQP